MYQITNLCLLTNQQFSKINIASYIDFDLEHHQVEVWIGSKPTTGQIVCSKDDVERPTIFIHYRREETKKIQIQPIKPPMRLTKRKVMEEGNSINLIKEDLFIEYTPTCQRSDFFINFSDLGWNNWILSPSGYEAGRCTRHCHAPLSVDTMPTNYARIMSVLR